MLVVPAALLHDSAGYDVDLKFDCECTEVLDPVSLIRSEMEMVCDDA
jgi:hypothetical protein